MSKDKTSFGYIEGDKIILSAWGEYPAREIGEVRDTPESTIAYFTDRFAQLCEKVDQIEKSIKESSNKGSYLMKLHHMEDRLAHHNGLGDYTALRTRIQNLVVEIQEIVKQNQLRNGDTKRQLIEELKIAVEKVNWQEASELVLDIKHRWIKTGNGSPEENEELEETFWPILNEFYDRRTAFYEDKARLAAHYESRYKELIGQAEMLRKEGLHPAKIRELKEAWKANGGIDRPVYKELLNQFNRALRPAHTHKPVRIQLEDLRKQLNQVMNLDELKNLQKKLKLIKTVSPPDRQLRGELFGEMSKKYEYLYLDVACAKNYHTFSSMSNAEQQQKRIEWLEDSIRQEKTALNAYQDNASQFTIRSTEVDDQLRKRLNRYRQNIRIKEEILRELKNNNPV